MNFRPVITALWCAALGLALQAPVAAPARAGEAGFVVQGVTLYDKTELLHFAHQHVQASDGVVSTARLAEAIELVYREDGYFLAEATVTPGTNGNTHVVVDEGRIDLVTVEGVDEKVHARIERYVQAIVGRDGVTQAEFERVLMLVNDLAGVTAVTGFDYPDPNAGAHLKITARQTNQAGSLVLDNPPREFGKAVSLYGTQEFYSVFTGGDLLRLQGGFTWHFAGNGKGHSLSGNAYYRTPLGPKGAYGELYGGNVVGRRDASGKYVATELTGYELGGVIGYPVLRDIHDYRYGLLEARHSAVDSSGKGVAFRSAVNAISALALAGHDDDDGAPSRFGLVATAGWRRGAIPLGEDDGDDSFWHLRASYGTAQPLPAVHHDLSYRFEINGQYSPYRLPSVEEFYLGGKTSLRGYRFAEASGDSGIAGIFELRHSWAEGAGPFSSLSVHAFFDAGHVVNNSPGKAETKRVTLASAGLGFRASFANSVTSIGHVGIPLVDGPFTRRFRPGFYLGVAKQW
ncbi:MAG: ShlB/FhaC/HecB family hemolysin secretion/activation protein [Notoacmeibacter sp.]|nr:ShlB/FhaC/HecB family hemolysin secretion/activation protein [Notoacmeibacter sp.]MCC0031801.1 ShlB/FhaC/HecB family hemolysin secretion/activation protein [Brucellaceae bacterium]